VERRDGRLRGTWGDWGVTAACLALVMASIGLAGCAVTSGSGKLVTTQVDESGFTGVKAADSWELTILHGDTYSVSVITDDNLADRLDVVVEGHTLVLRLKPEGMTRNVTLRATVVMPRLARLDLADDARSSVTGFESGGPLSLGLRDSSSARLDGLQATLLDARAADASSVSGAVRVDTCSLQLSDASEATLRGAARRLTLHVSDGSSADLRRLRAAHVTATLTDGSEATVLAGETLSAHLSDASDLVYSGSPRLGSVRADEGSSLTRAQEQ
jgi:hypothetical protein